MGVGTGLPAYGNSGYSLLGLPIITDANVATNLGTSTNQDAIYVVDLNECHLWEDGPQMVKFEEPAGKVAINMVLFGYSAFTSLRYPGAIAAINGTGLASPSF